MNPPHSTWARLALWPLSLVYRCAAAAHRTAYRTGWLAVERAPVPVVSVGNLSAGGTGKTPLVAAVCRLLDAEGRRTAVVSRGYRRRRSEGAIIVSRGEGRGPEVDVRSAGDEPFLLASLLPRSAVVVATRRIDGARLAAAELGADVVVADDAYQHHGMARDVDLLVIDAMAPDGGGWLLPAGALREPLSSARRASALLVSRSDRPGAAPDASAAFQRYNPDAPVFRTKARFPAVVLPDGREADVESLAGRSVLGFCGIGRPELFREDLRRLGLEVAGFTAFADHHWYDDHDMEKLARRAAAVGATLLMTTEKDYVKLSDADARVPPVARLRLEVEFVDAPGFRAFLLERLAAAEAA